MNVTNQVAAEVLPELGNIDIMFKAVIVLFAMGFVAVVAYAIYQALT